MKHNNLRFTIITFILSILVLTTTGCSVTRIVTNKRGYGIREIEARRSETREDQISRKDFQMSFDVMEDEFRFSLQYVPYYKVEQRDVIRYVPEMSLLDFGLGVASLALVGKIAYDGLGIGKELERAGWGGFTVENLRFDWEGMPQSEKVLLTGIAADWLLYYVIGEFRWTLHKPWKQLGEQQGPSQWLNEHPYRIEMPTYNFSKDYKTAYNAVSGISIPIFLSDFEEPTRLSKTESLQLQVSSVVDGESLEKSLRLTKDTQLLAFRNKALEALGIDMISTGKPSLMPRAKPTISWSKGSLPAGETANLEVTIQNIGKGELYQFTAKTVSQHALFNNRQLRFGKIDPGDSLTLSLAFKTDPWMRTQDIPMSLRFEEYNAYAPNDITMKLHVEGVPRPQFDYSFLIFDGGTPTSLGDSDGNIERGEAVDIRLTVTNIGMGTAEGVTATLTPPDGNDILIYGDSSVDLQNIGPHESRNAIFTVGVREKSSVTSSALNLSIRETNFKETALAEIIELKINAAAPMKVAIVDLNGTITTPNAAVRTSIGQNALILERLNQGAPVKISGELDDWYRLTLEGGSGWIPKNNVTKDTFFDLSKAPLDDAEQIDFDVDVRQNIPSAVKPNPDAVAVVIGIRNYQHKDIPPVDYATRDAHFVREYLKRTFGYDENNILPGDPNELITAGTFKTLIKQQLPSYCKDEKSDVFIYYSGHGAPNVVDKETFLVPYDCDPNFINRDNAYQLKDFYNDLSTIKCRSMTVVLDTCFSGKLATGGTLLTNISPLMVPTVEIPQLTQSNTIVMTSTSGDMVSNWYPEKKHSLFTYFFLKGVQGAADENRDNRITVAELETYLISDEEGVPFHARRQFGRPQMPEIDTQDKSAIIVELAK